MPLIKIYHLNLIINYYINQSNNVTSFITSVNIQIKLHKYNIIVFDLPLRNLSAKCLVRDDVHRQTFDLNRFKSVLLLHFLIVPLTIMSLFTFLIIEQKKLLSSPIASRQRAYELRLIFFLFLFDLKLRNKKKIIQTRRPIPFINESSKSK